MAVQVCARKAHGSRWASLRTSPRQSSQRRVPASAQVSSEPPSRQATRPTRTGKCAKKPSARRASRAARAAPFRVAHPRKRCLPPSTLAVRASGDQEKMQPHAEVPSRGAGLVRAPCLMRRLTRSGAGCSCSSIITWARRQMAMKSASLRTARRRHRATRRSRSSRSRRSSASRLQCLRQQRNLRSCSAKRRISRLSNCAKRVRLRPSRRSLKPASFVESSEGLLTSANRLATRKAIQTCQIPTHSPSNMALRALPSTRPESKLLNYASGSTMRCGRRTCSGGRHQV